MRFLLLSIAFLGFAATGFTQENVKLAQTLQANSVTIHTGRGQGSGVVVKRGDTHYILTAGHVVASLRQVQESVEGGAKKQKVVFDDAKVVTELYQDGASVGEIALRCEVIRYSNAENGEDLALLRVRKKSSLNDGVKFYLGTDIPGAGTELMHCGSLLGQLGSNSVTVGIVSQIGRNLNNTLYDQSCCATFPGSSGGGMFRKSSGEYVGMLVRGAGEAFNLYIPTRRILPWADRNGVKFIFDPALAIPSAGDMKKLPIEEPGSGTLRSPNRQDD